MTEHLHAIHAITHGRWGKLRSIRPVGWFWRNGGKLVDPLYVWSAAAGFLVALVLIVLAILMQTRPLH